MAARRYGKLRYVPARCPACGDRRADLDPPRDGSLLDKLFAWHYSRWHAYLVRKDPVWRIPQWYGYCGACGMKDALSAKSSFFDALSKTKETWQGGTITVPFSKR
jgi:hypothetical protein